MFKRTYKIKKLHNGELRDLEDVILIEKPVTIKINTNPMVSIICLPKDIKELAVGFLFTAGFIDSIEEIEDLEVDELENEVHITLNEKKELSIKDFETSSYNRVIKTSCGIPSVWRDLTLNSIDKTTKPLKDVKVPQELIFKCIVKMQSETILFKETGGCHGSALFDLSGELINLFEDIGRHNAIDKVIGSALIENFDLTETILCSTGRLTGDSVLKAVRSRIPILASISAPIESGVRIAFSYGVTLIGFVRGNKMNIYSNPERIVV